MSDKPKDKQAAKDTEKLADLTDTQGAESEPPPPPPPTDPGGGTLGEGGGEDGGKG